MALKTIGDLTNGGVPSGSSKVEAEVPGTPNTSVHHTFTQIAAFVASVLGRPGFRYTIDLDSTADSDPGAGLLKFNNATLASASFVYLDNTTADGADLSTYLGSLGATGFLRLVSSNDPGEWAVFKWTAITDGTGYRKIAVTYQAGLGSFEDSDEVLVLFDSDATGSSGVATDSIFDAAGDLVVGTGDNTAARLAKGTALQVLRVNAAGAALEWAAPSGGSGGTKTYALLSPMTSQPPASSYATLDTRNSIAVLDFDDSSAEGAMWVFVMPEGASLGSGLIVRLHWMATSATSGGVTWEVSVERMNTDLDADSFDTVATGTSTTNATSGIATTTAITITTIDSIAAGEPCRIRVRRLPADASDTMVGDAELICGEVRSAA